MALQMAATACPSALTDLLHSLRPASVAAKLLASKCISQYLASRYLTQLMAFSSPCHSRLKGSTST